MPTIDYEQAVWETGELVAGIDEVGRGALAGPVVSAAVVFSPPIDTTLLSELDDSKKLTPLQRKQIADKLQKLGVRYAVGYCESEEIDQLGIAAATAESMRRAIASLPQSPKHLLIDGTPIAGFPKNTTFIVKGDALSCSIAAASIVAKVVRDELMERRFAPLYPSYTFERNKGYGTKSHLDALRKYGPSPIHRRSYNPLRTILSQGVFYSGSRR